MKTRLFMIIGLLLFLYSVPGIFNYCQSQVAKKKIYMSFILHGNMNYDRYVKSTIWRDFPVIYNNLLDFIEEHPEFKGQLQLSGQSFKSLQQTAPYVIEHALKLHKRGQINFTGTFYSEPVNVSMDGEANLRCALLGTSIIKNEIGDADGYFLQEGAYHPQLPWILNNAGVTWVPARSGEETFFPFKLKGMDGSSITCISGVGRPADGYPELFKRAPDKSLLVISGDYEIPTSFANTYETVRSFLNENKEIDVEWITIKEYLEKFGVTGEKYIDHSTVKAKNIDSGTYSRWTADPLDIIIQDYTNHAMSDFRAASIVNSLTQYLFNTKIDEPFSNSLITLKHDPLIWDIEQAATYPDIEQKYLSNDNQITIMSKIEHLLLWGVNSDSRGWYPIYERRRERINSFENASALSKEMINRGLDIISKAINVKGFDRYFILFNSEKERVKILTIETNQPYDIYDYDGTKIRNTIISTGDKYIIEFESKLPAFGYKVIGLKKSDIVKEYKWADGNKIENGAIKVTALEDKIVFDIKGVFIEMSLDSFRIKALAEMNLGKGDDTLRKAVPYGKARISIREALYPQLRVEKQIDWLLHMEQVFTLLPDRILCENNFTFPHPTIIRKADNSGFNPEGLIVRFSSKKPGEVFYDIPFGITPHKLNELSYFCSLSSGIFQFNTGGGFMVTAGTGEQAFLSASGEGTMGLFLGASTTSGPIRNVGMEMVSKTRVEHEPAWYAEPFHGTYTHKFMLYPFDGSWQGNHAPAVLKNYTEGVYLHEFFPGKKSGSMPPEKSLISLDKHGIEITSMEIKGTDLQIRLNDKEKSDTDVKLTIGTKTRTVHIPANGIINLVF